MDYDKHKAIDIIFLILEQTEGLCHQEMNILKCFINDYKDQKENVPKILVLDWNDPIDLDTFEKYYEYKKS